MEETEALSLSRRISAIFVAFVKTARTAGLGFALRKVRERIARKLARTLRFGKIGGTRFFARVFGQNLPVDRFRELPWNTVGKDSGSALQSEGHFKILLISHSACRTGAPLCLLRLADELGRIPDVECFVVLKQGGELAGSFARLAPTLDVERLVARGLSRHEVPRVIASAFHDFASAGVAVCNTMAVSEFHAAFREAGVPVLSWIHELPTFMSLFGGERAIAQIGLASRKIMVPSGAVGAALESRFGIDGDSIRTVYNGQDPNTQGLDRLVARGEVRRELGLPPEARIVLGCGTIDLRKGPDVFVNVARAVLLDPAFAGESPLTCFVWVGQCHDENLQRWVLHDAEINGLQDRIRFIGPRSTVALYYLAADLLALTSREDPCPLVNMEAMESGLPVVAFVDAGGAPEVLDDAGICVPYLDVGAMAVAVCRLLSNDALRQEMGRRGQARIRERFTWHRFMEEFRDILRTDFQYRRAERLKVSVIVPNFRHARYLEGRIQSVFDQTYEPHEIIVLDDASPDQSVRIAKRMSRRAKVPMRIIANERNSGSTFHQWLKGMSLATGDLVWFAESDDSAHPLFLERLVPEFFDPDVTLAYCQSALIGPGGERLDDDFLAHTDDISTTRWRSRYSVPAAVEAEIALSQKNTIPNASAVVFRRPESIDFGDELLTYKFAGDWFFYAMLISGGKVSFIPETLNFYRRHEATVSHRSIRDATQAYESLCVKAKIFETYSVTPRAITSSLERSELEYDQLTSSLKLDRPAFRANPELTGVLDRIRATLNRRLCDPAPHRITPVPGDRKAS
jgi:glycosyltransferase involved in cell wall biosynthesis